MEPRRGRRKREREGLGSVRWEQTPTEQEVLMALKKKEMGSFLRNFEPSDRAVERKTGKAWRKLAA